jgi:DNA-directed RNA polymerase subunit L
MFSNLEYTKYKDGLTFEIKDVDLSYVNGLRRAIMTDIPIVAVCFKPQEPINNDIIFIQNTSSLHNEFLGHRISLIPLCFTLDETENYNRDDYKFILNVENKTDDIILVTTDDIKILNSNGVMQTKEFHARIFPHNPITKEPILITKLKPNLHDIAKGELLHVEFYASVSTAHECALWSPVSQSTFMNQVNNEAAETALKAYLKEQKEKSQQSNVDILVADFNALQRFRYYYKDNENNPTRFKFSLETVCGIGCHTLVSQAFRVLKKKFDFLKGSFDESIKVDGQSNNINMIYIDQCNHTHGGILQSYIYRNMKSLGVEYVGYHMPHPLEERIILKVKYNGNVKEIMLKVLGEISSELLTFKKNWDTLGS